MGWVDGLKTRLGSALMAWRSRPGRVRRFLRRRPMERRPPDPGGEGVPGSLAARRRNTLRVAAVQMRLEFTPSAEAYAEQCYRLVRRAARAGAELVCFPEDAATHLLGLVPGIGALSRAGSVDRAVSSFGPGVRVKDLFAFAGPATERVYDTTFRELARGFGLWVAAGSAVLPEPGGRVINQARLYGPDGRLVAVQAKCHLLPMEAGWGLEPGDDLTVVETPLVTLGLPVCMDATYYETFRILSLRGVELVILPTANPEPYNFWTALRGAWPRAQESLVFAVNPCLVGNVLGLTLTGRSGIFAPLELTPNLDGVLVQADDPHSEGVIWADLDLETLRRLRRERASRPGPNLPLLEKYFPAVYDQAPARLAEARRRTGAAGDGFPPRPIAIECQAE